jgi:hypothetical protein
LIDAVILVTTHPSTGTRVGIATLWKVQIDGQEAVIVGVTERGFRFPKQANVWIPRKQ